MNKIGSEFNFTSKNSPEMKTVGSNAFIYSYYSQHLLVLRHSIFLLIFIEVESMCLVIDDLPPLYFPQMTKWRLQRLGWRRKPTRQHPEEVVEGQFLVMVRIN